MSWLQSNAQVIAAFASVGTAIIWLVYLHLFLQAFREQRQSRVLLQQVTGTSVGSECVLVNMADSHVNIMSILLAAQSDERESVRELEALATDLPDEQQNDQTRQTMRRRRGPVPPGGTAHLGTFDVLLRIATQAMHADYDDADETELASIEIRVVYFFRTRPEPAGACRRFYIDRRDHMTRVRPETVRTHQLTRWRDRRRVRQWYMQAFD